MSGRLADLTAQGVSLWLDDLSRQRIHSGNLQHLIDTCHISGVTTNPSIFQAALSDGAVDSPGRSPGHAPAASSVDQQQLDELAARGASIDDVVRTMTTDDVRDACDLFSACSRPPDTSTAGSPSRSTRGSRTRPRPPSIRPRSCPRSSTGPTC